MRAEVERSRRRRSETGVRAGARMTAGRDACQGKPERGLAAYTVHMHTMSAARELGPAHGAGSPQASPGVCHLAPLRAPTRGASLERDAAVSKAKLLLPEAAASRAAASASSGAMLSM